MNHSTPGLSVHHQLPESNPNPCPLSWWCHRKEMLLLSHFSHVRLCATPWMAAHQPPPSMGFSKQEYWSGMPLPSLIARSYLEVNLQRYYKHTRSGCKHSWNMKPVVMWGAGLHGTFATDSLDNFRQVFLLSLLQFFHLVHHSNLAMKQEPWIKNTSLKYMMVIVALTSLHHVQLFETPWTEACQASLSSTIAQNLLKFMSTESVILPSHLILCHPLLLLPSIFSSIRVFSNESALWIYNYFLSKRILIRILSSM